MKNIEEAAVDRSKMHQTTFDKMVCENDFKAGVAFAQRWIPATEKPELGTTVLVKTNKDLYNLLRIEQEIDIEILQRHFDFWRQIELK
jgi:hypothetical protein